MTELVAIHTSDNLELPGLLYAPDKPTKKAALYLHGNGDNGVFYKPVHCNALGAALSARGIAFLALNNRGAHNKKKVKLIDEASLAEHKRYPGGAHYEKIMDSIQDIDGAADFLQSRGYDELYIIGESTGANKICVYDAHAPKPQFSKYVLAGPGDDSGLYYNILGAQKFKQSIMHAKQAIATGKPLTIMPKYSGMNPFSAQSTFDMLDPDQPYNTFPYHEATTGRLGTKKLFGDYSQITRPMYIVFGENDEYTYTAGGTKQAIDLLRQNTSKAALPTSKFEIIPGADHGFSSYDDVYAKKVADWLAE